MEYFEEIWLGAEDHKPAEWFMYVKDTFVVRPHGPSRLQQFLHYINNLPSYSQWKFETSDTPAFLDILVMKRGPELAMKVYQKPTHTGCCLHFKYSHLHRMKKGVIYSLIIQVKIICQDQKDFSKEIKNTRHDLMLNECPQESVDSIFKPSRSNSPSDIVHQGMIIILCVKGISKKFRCVGNYFNIRAIFKTKDTLHGLLMKTGPVRDVQRVKLCVYNTPCDCSRYYINETSRHLEVHVEEHKYKVCMKNQN
jgi:hypothetical protein